ncbi:hypothetical protein [Neorhizobium galegae]|uniref:hypothetical protein n=1 Tax=Neorhizobium galegae TaxID=399 RepID=UPI0006212D66|nr:hypothetical protein [Neorhizobium galegae]CDZ55044.1 Hypothetical protein NGAL_HAMBI2427_59590 [Neorhizobium galegae bv. orientalis]
MACTCVETVNEKLKERNTRLTQAIVFSPRKDDCLMLVTEQIETGRGKPKAVAMFLTYCPFCGVAYDG